jgi:hypothetical protein
VSHQRPHRPLLLCSAPRPLPFYSDITSVSALCFILPRHSKVKSSAGQGRATLSYLAWNNTKLAWISSPPRPAPPRAFHLQRLSALHCAYQQILRFGGDLAPRTQFLHLLVWRKLRFSLSTIALPLRFLSSSTTRESRAQTQDSTFEDPNLRPSAPLKRNPLICAQAPRRNSFALASISHLAFLRPHAFLDEH